MDVTALLSHPSADSIVAYRGGQAVRAAEFLAEAERLAQLLPPGRHVLNACADRYRFAVGLAASLTTGRVSLLPSTHTPEVIKHLIQLAPDAFCLTDDETCTIELPRLHYSDATGPGSSDTHPPGTFRVPYIPDDQLAAIVFTSGSTGTPLPYRKTWGRLAGCVRAEAHELGIMDGRRFTLVGTVPPQHMYGFESTVLVALQSANSFTAERPFYPADIAAAVAAAPRPRVLVTTPVHLRTLLASTQDFPPIAAVLSATAPLDAALAQQVDARLRAPLLEMFGSTETCVIATRLTARESGWRLYPGVTVEPAVDHAWVRASWFDQPMRLQDVVEISADGRMLLRGRNVDMVEIAGKRASLSDLTRRLLDIPGVRDAVVFQPSDTEAEAQGVGRVHRIAAAVVAPTLTAAEILTAMARSVDAVFLPRPLLRVNELPRNELGKTGRAQLLQLLEHAPD
jgi:acyl-coenzyme A synthetase/AMP-(fatty) acid ligase